jgi:hypothetical protein
MMKHIKELKIALMEQDTLAKKNKKNKKNFIIKHSAKLNVQQLLLSQNINEDDYEDNILHIVSTIYKELLDNKKENTINYVGLWVTFEDETTIDNSISINVFNDIKKFAIEELDPMQEFFKMTVNSE